MPLNNLTELVNQLLEEEGNPLAASTIPAASLEQNAPNPFNQVTTIAYTLPKSYQSAWITVTTVSGNIVKTDTHFRFRIRQHKY